MLKPKNQFNWQFVDVSEVFLCVETGYEYWERKARTSYEGHYYVFPLGKGAGVLAMGGYLFDFEGGSLWYWESDKGWKRVWDPRGFSYPMCSQQVYNALPRTLVKGLPEQYADCISSLQRLVTAQGLNPQLAVLSNL